MICWRAMAEHGGDYDLVVRPAHDRVATPSEARDLSNTALVTLCWKTLSLLSG
jgi:hypothetical protein